MPVTPQVYCHFCKAFTTEPREDDLGLTDEAQNDATDEAPF